MRHVTMLTFSVLAEGVAMKEKSSVEECAVVAVEVRILSLRYLAEAESWDCSINSSHS
jgi:hypothetical protein